MDRGELAWGCHKGNSERQILISPTHFLGGCFSPFDRLLVYVTGGLAIGGVSATRDLDFITTLRASVLKLRERVP